MSLHFLFPYLFGIQCGPFFIKICGTICSLFISYFDRHALSLHCVFEVSTLPFHSKCFRIKLPFWLNIQGETGWPLISWYLHILFLLLESQVFLTILPTFFLLLAGQIFITPALLFQFSFWLAFLFLPNSLPLSCGSGLLRPSCLFHLSYGSAKFILALNMTTCRLSFTAVAVAVVLAYCGSTTTCLHIKIVCPETIIFFNFPSLFCSSCMGSILFDGALCTAVVEVTINFDKYMAESLYTPKNWLVCCSTFF